jgi:hypothetical protein
MNAPRTRPPRFATLLLRACCTPSYREEIEGDLHELFERRAARMGAARAGRRYTLEVWGVCLRQLTSRAGGALRLSRRVRIVLGIVGVLLTMVALLFSSDQHWPTIVGYVILCGLGVLEVLVYVSAFLSSLKALRQPVRGPQPGRPDAPRVRDSK